MLSRRRSGVLIAYVGHISHCCSTFDFEEVYGKRQTSVFLMQQIY